MRFVFGIEGLPTSTPPDLRGVVNLGFGSFPLYRLFLIAATAVIVLGLWLFIEKTRYGLIIRAGSRDAEIVKVLGIDIAKVWLLVFGIGTAIAGLSGLLAAPTRAVNPEMGIPILAESFVVTVVGGMGSLPGAVVAGLLVGIGTRYASGCTSGHGVCGLSRLSPRSLLATASFMSAGFVMVYVLRHVL
jgi:branched-chain amino acid transport system permease protein